MFGYYGSKTNLATLYPKPIHDTIIERFAGAAKYSLLHFEKEVILIDKYKTIIDIWKWLQSCSSKDILSLPKTLNYGDRLGDIKFDCQEQKYFYGFIIGFGAERPRLAAIKRKTEQRPNHINYGLNRVAKDLFKIKHWKFIHGDYLDYPVIDNVTEFLDPPYQFGGASYVHSNKNFDYNKLANFILNFTNQQVIACENTKANWLQFVPLINQRGSTYKTTEAIYTNFHTHYNNIQQSLNL